MSRIINRRLFWDPVDVPDLDVYEIYMAPHDVVNFSSRVDAGQVGVFAETDLPEFILDGNLGIDEGRYQFAVTARDVNGNISDPHQPEAWRDVPLDLTAPPAPTNGGIELLTESETS